MTALFAVLISGVLLNHMGVPMPKYHLAFISSDGRQIGDVTTDKDGKFSVTLAPGTYRVLIGTDGTMESITVDKNTSKLELHRRAPVEPKREHVIEVIRGTQRDIMRFPLAPPAPVAPVIHAVPPRVPPPVIEAPQPRIYFDVPIIPGPRALDRS